MSPPPGNLTNIWTSGRKATLSEPWEVAPDVSYAFKPKRLNRFGANVRDCFFDRIRRENHLQIRGTDLPALRHLLDETDELSPIIGSHNYNRKMFNFLVLNPVSYTHLTLPTILRV